MPRIVRRGSTRGRRRGSLVDQPLAVPGPSRPRTETRIDPTVTTHLCDDSRDSNCHCIVEELIESPFLARKCHEQYSIVANGKPTPPIRSLSTGGPISPEIEDVFQTCIWLCGCTKTKRLYCWPCLLFTKLSDGWPLRVFTHSKDVYNLPQSHAETEIHINSMISLSRFNTILSEQAKINVETHNKSVKRNRYAVWRLIDATCYFAEQQLPLDCKGNLETSNNYSALLNLLRRYDNALDTLLDISDSFANITPDDAYGISDSITDVMLSKIRNEISMSKYFSIIFEQITDVTSNRCKIATIIRYYDVKNECVFERFVGFEDFQMDSALHHYFHNIKEIYGRCNRLVAISYNGPIFSLRRNKNLIQDVRRLCGEVYYVQYHGVGSFFTLKNILENIPECKLFFNTLSGISKFFSNTPEVTSVLHEEIKEMDPSFISASWALDEDLIASIFKYKLSMTNCFKKILNNCAIWDVEINNNVTGFLATINDVDFAILLQFFNEILPQTKCLFDFFPGNQTFDANNYKQSIEAARVKLDVLKRTFSFFWAQFYREFRNKISLENNLRMQCRKLYFRVIDTLKLGLSDRRFHDHIASLSFINLLELKLFSNFSKNFPDSLVLSLQNSIFKDLFNFILLKKELCILYNNEAFHKHDIYELHKYILSCGLSDAFVEVCKLIELFVSFPLAPASGDVSFAATKRIYHFLERSHRSQRPYSLAMLAIERKLLLTLKSNDSFYNDVTDEYAKKIPFVNLTYE